MWQDIALAICNFGWSIAVIQQFIHLLKVKSMTQISWYNVGTTVPLLWLADIAMMSMHMYLTVIALTVQACAWTLILVLKIAWRNRKYKRTISDIDLYLRMSGKQIRTSFPF